MGVKAQAYLVYGIDLGSDIPEVLNPYSDGRVNLEVFLRDAAGLQAVGYTSPAYATYAAKMQELQDTCPIDLCLYGPEDEAHYVLHVRGCQVRANDFNATRLELNMLTVDEAKVAAAKAFCEAHGIGWSTPAWHLIAWSCC